MAEAVLFLLCMWKNRQQKQTRLWTVLKEPGRGGLQGTLHSEKGHQPQRIEGGVFSRMEWSREGAFSRGHGRCKAQVDLRHLTGWGTPLAVGAQTEGASDRRGGGLAGRALGARVQAKWLPQTAPHRGNACTQGRGDKPSSVTEVSRKVE